MTVDQGKVMPLPSGPASLCFDKDAFMKSNFEVDEFIMECRRRVQLETLRDDLNTYLKILRSAMIELINKDYADFVNLSTNLVGMDKAIGNLTSPLCELRDEVMKVRMAMDEAIAAVEQKLKQREEIRQKKACLQRLMNIVQSVEKIERLLGIQMTSSDETSTCGKLNGQLIERVANEFNKLQFYVTKSTGLPLVEKIKPRITNITTTLQYSLEGHFVEGLESGNTEILQQCLRTYALIDKIKDVEMLFRKHIVKPYMEEIINEQALKRSGKGHGLKDMYKKIIEFIPQRYKILKEVTTGGVAGASEIVRGYDFLVNAVWPEIVCNIEARTPSIFAPGNPDVFHEKFTTSMDFLEEFERHCGSQASVKRLREHQSYHTYVTKWSLPVYYQIRFQEVAGTLESSLCTAFNNSSDTTLFRLHSTQTLYTCITRCWAEDVYMQPLCHRFWKLTLQLLSRYRSWLDEAYTQEIENRNSEADKQKTVSASQLDKTQGAGDKATPIVEGQTIPATPPVTLGQIICLISDVETFCIQIISLFDETIKPRLVATGVDNPSQYLENVQECVDGLTCKLPKYKAYIIEDVRNQCCVHLKQVSDIPRLYRRTNREVPKKPSSYIMSVFKPVKMFVEEHESILSDKQKDSIFLQVFSSLAEQYHSLTSDVLMSVKKMEDSLKRLKKVRGTDKGSGTQGMSDDDKIRQQIILDIDSYGIQIDLYGVQKQDLEEYKKLKQLSAEAKDAMTTASQ